MRGDPSMVISFHWFVLILSVYYFVFHLPDRTPTIIIRLYTEDLLMVVS